MHPFRRFPRLTFPPFGLVLLLAVAACGPAPEPTADMAAGATAGAPTEAAGAEMGGAFTCEDALGCLDIAAGDPVKVGYMLVIAGADQQLGIDSRRGAELALADTPEFRGHPVELEGEDSGCSAEGGQAAATKLAADDTLVAIIGPSCSSEARAGTQTISDAGLTLLSPSATGPDLTEPGKHIEGFLRTAHNDKVQGKVAAEFVFNELGLKTAATIHDGSPYAEGLVKVFTENFQALGGTITGQEVVSPDDTDMRPVLTSIATGNPELLYYPIFTQAGGFVTTQSKEVSGLESVQGLMGADGMFSPNFISAAGDAAVGMYLSSPDFSAFGSAYRDEFLPAHEAEYGEAPVSAFHAHAYDAYNVILAALDKIVVEDADGTLHIGRQAMRDALYETEAFQGLTGSLTCDDNGDCADPAIAVYQLTAENVASQTVPTEKIYPKSE